MQHCTKLLGDGNIIYGMEFNFRKNDEIIKT